MLSECKEKCSSDNVSDATTTGLTADSFDSAIESMTTKSESYIDLPNDSAVAGSSPIISKTSDYQKDIRSLEPLELSDNPNRSFVFTKGSYGWWKRRAR